MNESLSTPKSLPAPKSLSALFDDKGNPLPIYVDEKIIAAVTGRSRSSLQSDRHNGVGLPYVKQGKSVRYFLPDTYTDMEAHRVIPVGAA